jgi:hypothetical protein
MDKKYYVLIALFILMLIGMASSQKTKMEQEKAKVQAISHIQQKQAQTSISPNTVNTYQ